MGACSSDNSKSSASTAAPASAAPTTESAATAASATDASTTEASTAATATDSSATEPSTEATNVPSTDATTASSTEVTSAPADALECAGPAATGDAVKVGIVWPEGPAINIPEIGDSAGAAVKYTNECLGGVGGRPIELDSCTIDETNPAAATTCGNQFVEDGVAAVVVTITSQGATLVPIVTGAGIPYIVSGGTSPAESLDATGLVFSVSGGVAAALGAMAQDAKDQGIAKVALLVSDNAAAGVQGLSGIPFGKAGVAVNVVSVPAGTPDMTPQLSAALSDGAGETIVIGDATLCISYLQAAQSIDPDGKHGVIVTCVGDDVITAVGDALDGATLYGGGPENSDDPEHVLYLDVMAKYSPATPTTGFTGVGYQVVTSLVRGLAGLTGDVNAASVASTMKATKDIVSPAGFGQTFSCSEKPLPPLTVCSGDALISTIKGTEVTDPKLFDASPLYTG
ncbi:MAG: putative lipoprotein [Acidimicrobiales bacterium]|nr:putative lipoprotein [Acidimicrobiales bacterium]